MSGSSETLGIDDVLGPLFITSCRCHALIF